MRRTNNKEFLKLRDKALKLKTRQGYIRPELTGIGLWIPAFAEDGMNQTDIGFIMNSTRTHIIKLMRIHEELGLLKMTLKGRDKIITLTDDGRKVKGLLNALREYFV